MNCNDRQFFNLAQSAQERVTRRTFLQRAAGGIGLAALGGLMGQPAKATGMVGLPDFPNFAPKAKRIIYPVSYTHLTLPTIYSV